MPATDELLVTRPLSPRQLIAVDVLMATAYAMLLLLFAVVIPAGAAPASPVPMAVRVGIVLAVALPIAARRRWPEAVVLWTAVFAVAALVLGVTRDGFVGTALALYIVAARGDPSPPALTRAAGIVGLVGLVLLVAAGSPAATGGGIDALIVPVVLLAGAWAIGRAVAERRRYAERTAAERVERALADERLRIARDLHDIVSHGLGLMVVTAGTANHVLDERPEEARAALATIETTGRTALTEMRRLLDVLRTGDIDDPSLEPAPGIADLPALVERIERTGVRVHLEMERLTDLPAGVSLMVFRIVQEALTNVVRHAGATSCRVTLRAVGDAVQVEVADDGGQGARPTAGMEHHTAPDGASDGTIAGPTGAPGHGLLGMQERVRMLGGDFAAGPSAEGGFRVVARIPGGATAASMRSMPAS